METPQRGRAIARRRGVSRVAIVPVRARVRSCSGEPGAPGGRTRGYLFMQDECRKGVIFGDLTKVIDNAFAGVS